MPAAGDLLAIGMGAPRHTFRNAERDGLSGAATAPDFALTRTERRFAVLVALCEPRPFTGYLVAYTRVNETQSCRVRWAGSSTRNRPPNTTHWATETIAG